MATTTAPVRYSAITNLDGTYELIKLADTPCACGNNRPADSDVCAVCWLDAILADFDG